MLCSGKLNRKSKSAKPLTWQDSIVPYYDATWHVPIFPPKQCRDDHPFLGWHGMAGEIEILPSCTALMRRIKMNIKTKRTPIVKKLEACCYCCCGGDGGGGGGLKQMLPSQPIASSFRLHFFGPCNFQTGCRSHAESIYPKPLAKTCLSIGNFGMGMCIFVKLARGPSSSLVMHNLVLERMSRVSWLNPTLGALRFLCKTCFPKQLRAASYLEITSSDEEERSNLGPRAKA